MRHDPLRDLRPLIDRVYAYVAYRVGAGPDAEDITNEVFERALRYRASYDRSKGEPTAWLIGIARRCIDGRRPSDVAAADAPEVEASGELDTTVLSRVELQGALAALDDRSRELIALRYAADLSAREIGELLGLRTNTVEVAIHRALARLREALEAAGTGSASAFSPAAGRKGGTGSTCR